MTVRQRGHAHMCFLPGTSKQTRPPLTFPGHSAAPAGEEVVQRSPAPPGSPLTCNTKPTFSAGQQDRERSTLPSGPSSQIQLRMGQSKPGHPPPPPYEDRGAQNKRPPPPTVVFTLEHSHVIQTHARRRLIISASSLFDGIKAQFTRTRGTAVSRALGARTPPQRHRPAPLRRGARSTHLCQQPHGDGGGGAAHGSEAPEETLLHGDAFIPPLRTCRTTFPRLKLLARAPAAAVPQRRPQERMRDALPFDVLV